MFAEQLEQVRCAVLVSALIFSPIPHEGCGRQVADLCELVDWYVFAGQARQFAELSLYWPLEQVRASGRYAFNFPAAVLHADALRRCSCTWCTANPLGRCNTHTNKKATQQNSRSAYMCEPLRASALLTHPFSTPLHNHRTMHSKSNRARYVHIQSAKAVPRHQSCVTECCR